LIKQALEESFVVPSGSVLYFDVFKNDMLLSLSLYLYLSEVFGSMMALWRRIVKLDGLLKPRTVSKMRHSLTGERYG
jgi:hypothetical protein